MNNKKRMYLIFILIFGVVVSAMSLPWLVKRSKIVIAKRVHNLANYYFLKEDSAFKRYEAAQNAEIKTHISTEMAQLKAEMKANSATEIAVLAKQASDLGNKDSISSQQVQSVVQQIRDTLAVNEAAAVARANQEAAATAARANQEAAAAAARANQEAAAAAARASQYALISGRSPDTSSLVFGILDAVGPYRKNGLFEIYGASFRERRVGPIRVSEADIEVSHDQALVVWSPDFSPVRNATHLEVDLAELPKAGSVTIGFLLGDVTSAAYSYDFGPAAPAAGEKLEPVWPTELLAKVKSAAIAGKFQLRSSKLVVALGPQFLTSIGKGDPTIIQHSFVHINGAANTTLHIRQLGLTRAAEPQPQGRVSIAGIVRVPGLPPGTKIEIVDETGQTKSQTLALDGRFVFPDLDPKAPVSVRLRHNQLFRYSNLGRWFVPGFDRDDVAVDIRPHYVNNDGHAPDPKTAKFVGARTPSKVAAFYEPHSRQYWPGGSTLQEYDSITFTNNYGYVDRDRFFDNPDQCLRLASTGGSDMVSLQIRPFEKSNIILEELLGVKLGRCVEVISAATDNGDIGTNYPRIRDYTSKFNVDGTLVSFLSGLLSQVSPKMLRDGLGFDAENNVFPGFVFDKNNQLKFLPASPVFALFTEKPTLPEYVKGIPFGLTLTVPFEVMPAPGKEAYRHWSAIVEYIERAHPGQKLIFHSGIDQAQCRKNCDNTVTLPNGQKVRAGAMSFVQNFREYCAMNNYTCINPGFSDIYGEEKSLLTFRFDGHYSPLGQQWLAEELVGPLASIYKNAAK